jgi:parvulin-like peptidyl-prolyl isomerase
VRLETVDTADRRLAEEMAQQLRKGTPLETLSELGAGIRPSSGWIKERDLPPELKQQFEGAAPNNVIGPVASGGRFRVIRLRERQVPRQLSYEESRNLIETRLRRNREQAVLDEWHERAKGKAQIQY